MRIMNKRGVAQAIVDTGLALIVVFIGILLLMIATKVNESNKIGQGKKFMESATIENNVALWLKKPVDVEGTQMSMADLTVLAAENPIYKQFWEQNAGHLGFSYIRVLGTDLVYDPSNEGDESRVTKIILPSHNSALEIHFSTKKNLIKPITTGKTQPPFTP